MVPIPPMVMARSGKHYLPSCSTEGCDAVEDSVEKYGGGELEFCIARRVKKTEGVLKLCSHRWLQGRSNRCLLDYCSTRRGAGQDSFLACWDMMLF